MQWQALLVYHPLWEVHNLRSETRWDSALPDVAIPRTLYLPAVTLQPMLTPEAERRRQQVMQSAAQQQQALMARLQQMEMRRLQEEVAQLHAQQRAKEALALQEALLWAQRETEQALSQHYWPQANSELQRQVLRRLVRLRHDLRDYLRERLQQIEAQQELFADTLRQRLASIEEETARRLDERKQEVQNEFERQREQLRQQSAQRLQMEQTLASVMVRPFAVNGKPVTLPLVSLQAAPATESRIPSPRSVPFPTRQQMHLWIEQDVKQWAEAICRKHHWVPVWQQQAGLPDVTAQIAQEMQGTAL
ncbi:MAG: hypothetical protein RMM06_00845 [Armatimonadota bacterium]|nr:hypothetical protein [bacterium]MCS7309192.1 hypothetical protein [Armatimonadota bacterium]MDW8103379.1 hypothetical protein [Armatimonadota bacterium]MDW8289241.1 hypothetical protein [Armatimonadota bacterium]